MDDAFAMVSALLSVIGLVYLWIYTDYSGAFDMFDPKSIEFSHTSFHQA